MQKTPKNYREFQVARAIVHLNEPAKPVSAVMVDRHRSVGLATMRSERRPIEVIFRTKTRVYTFMPGGALWHRCPWRLQIGYWSLDQLICTCTNKLRCHVRQKATSQNGQNDRLYLHCLKNEVQELLTLTLRRATEVDWCVMFPQAGIVFSHLYCWTVSCRETLLLFVWVCYLQTATSGPVSIMLFIDVSSWKERVWHSLWLF